MNDKQPLNIEALRDLEPAILCVGSHPATIQAILDFDFLLGRQQPTVKAVMAGGRKSERYFFGQQEVTIPVYESPERIPEAVRSQINLFMSLVSGRRVLSTVSSVMDNLPGLRGGVIFAERVPERHALELYDKAQSKGVWILGGASVGLVITGSLKLGAIGGVEARQFEASNLFAPGQVAVVSSSGGMVNEIIRTVANTGYGVSFALAVGGERFPITAPKQAFLAAENDPSTKAVVYFGELGGTDEYEIADMLKSGQITKPVVCYIAGVVADLFEAPPQFGHAKAMAGSSKESAAAKRQLLEEAGAQVGESFADFVQKIQGLGLDKIERIEKGAEQLMDRKKGLITSSVSYDKEGEVHLLGSGLLEQVESKSFAGLVMSMLLGKPEVKPETEEFADYVLRLLVDHGPYVSGAMNTIVTARAGRDLVSALSTGLLTIGPRFGGAINEAAAIWLRGVKEGIKPADLVEEFAAKRQYISGIGHRKYRADMPDPRVQKVTGFAEKLPQHPFTDFARAVEAETLQKKANLILNVDGAIAATLLDILQQSEGYDNDALADLTDQEFFNALFVLSRSVGFMAHYFDQRRIDEGLFRLPTDQVTRLENN
jgi:ATP citrate (pro-S)-lyase